MENKTVTLFKHFVENVGIFVNGKQQMELLFSNMTLMVAKINYGSSNLYDISTIITFISYKDQKLNIYPCASTLLMN
jgi:hypothetical protein